MTIEVILRRWRQRQDHPPPPHGGQRSARMGLNRRIVPPPQQLPQHSSSASAPSPPLSSSGSTNRLSHENTLLPLQPAPLPKNPLCCNRQFFPVTLTSGRRAFWTPKVVPSPTNYDVTENPLVETATQIPTLIRATNNAPHILPMTCQLQLTKLAPALCENRPSFPLNTVAVTSTSPFLGKWLLSAALCIQLTPPPPPLPIKTPLTHIFSTGPRTFSISTAPSPRSPMQYEIFHLTFSLPQTIYRRQLQTPIVFCPIPCQHDNSPLLEPTFSDTTHEIIDPAQSFNNPYDQTSLFLNSQPTYPLTQPITEPLLCAGPPLSAMIDSQTGPPTITQHPSQDSPGPPLRRSPRLANRPLNTAPISRHAPRQTRQTNLRFTLPETTETVSQELALSILQASGLQITDEVQCAIAQACSEDLDTIAPPTPTHGSVPPRATPTGAFI